MTHPVPANAVANASSLNGTCWYSVSSALQPHARLDALSGTLFYLKEDSFVRWPFRMNFLQPRASCTTLNPT